MACDARHQRRENQRRDDGLDQSQKDITEDTETNRQRRRIEAKLGPRHHRNKDPRRQGAALKCEQSQKHDGDASQGDSGLVNCGTINHPMQDPSREENRSCKQQKALKVRL